MIARFSLLLPGFQQHFQASSHQELNVLSLVSQLVISC
jgi:hypothetical protein